jgi:hypothetical protein
VFGGVRVPFAAQSLSFRVSLLEVVVAFDFDPDPSCDFEALTQISRLELSENDCKSRVAVCSIDGREPEPLDRATLLRHGWGFLSRRMHV